MRRLPLLLVLLLASAAPAWAQYPAPVRASVASFVWSSTRADSVLGWLEPGDTVVVHSTALLTSELARSPIQLFQISRGVGRNALTGYVLATTVEPLGLPGDLVSAPSVSPAPATPTNSDGSVRVYRKGTRGGCYYVSDSGRRVYVERSFCEGADAP